MKAVNPHILEAETRKCSECLLEKLPNYQNCWPVDVVINILFLSHTFTLVFPIRIHTE